MTYFDITIPCQAFRTEAKSLSEYHITLIGVSDDDMAIALGNTEPTNVGERIADRFIQHDGQPKCEACEVLAGTVDSLDEKLKAAELTGLKAQQLISELEAEIMQRSEKLAAYEAAHGPLQYIADYQPAEGDADE